MDMKSSIIYIRYPPLKLSLLNIVGVASASIIRLFIYPRSILRFGLKDIKNIVYFPPRNDIGVNFIKNVSPAGVIGCKREVALKFLWQLAGLCMKFVGIYFSLSFYNTFAYCLRRSGFFIPGRAMSSTCMD